MTANQEIIQYNDVINRIYQKNNLKCLRGLEGENLFEIDGRNILTWHSDAIKPFQTKDNFPYLFKNFEDIILISDELIYFTANSILYEPLINDPIRQKIDHGQGNYTYPNYANLYAKRFDMFNDICFEKIYNYWDRIGDLIAACIDTELDSTKIYFHSVISKLSRQYSGNEDFKWLLDYYNGEYKYINSIRRNIVHYFSSGTEFSTNHLYNSNNLEEITRLMAERRQIPTILKSGMLNSIEGFKHTLDFLLFVGQNNSN